jgi:flagellar biosynthetic protein FliR
VNVDALGVPLLVFARVAAVLVVLPPFSAKAVPRRLRVLIAVMVTVLLLPVLPAAPAPDGLPALAMAVVRESAVGLLAGGTVRASLSSVQMAAEIASSQGLGFATMFDPFLATNESSLATLASTLAMALFVSAGLHGRCLEAIATSFFVCPPGAAIPGGPGLIQAVVAAFSLGLQLSGPVLAMMLLVNGAVAMLSRLAPRMNTFLSVGIALFAFVSVFMAALTLPYWLDLHMVAAAEAVRNLGAAWAPP